MGMDIFDRGGLIATVAASRCQCCEVVEPSVQLTTATGYVVICETCLPRVVAVMTISGILHFKGTPRVV